MSVSRRSFILSSAAALGTAGAPTPAVATHCVTAPRRDPGFDPWLEIDPGALRHNVRAISHLAGGRPILAVLKNNAYGLGLVEVGHALDSVAAVAGFAVVKTAEAMALRDARIRKPILLMGQFDDAEVAELVARDVALAPFTDDAAPRIARVSRALGRPVPVHLYLDTGMSRLGMPYRRALPWIEELAARPEVRVEGAFMTFTEEDDFDPEQLSRFLALAAAVRARGVGLGRLHAASSHALFFRSEALLDMVRPGLALYGAYPDGARDLAVAELRPACRLRARLVRVERLEPGDTVSYGRNFVAREPTWVATLPVGHADGYPRKAVEGCEVVIGGGRYRVIGAVSASHTIVLLGREPRVRLGEVATLLGPDDAAIHPNEVARRAGVSVYDVLMHLGGAWPRVVVWSRDSDSSDAPAN